MLHSCFDPSFFLVTHIIQLKICTHQIHSGQLICSELFRGWEQVRLGKAFEFF